MSNFKTSELNVQNDLSPVQPTLIRSTFPKQRTHLVIFSNSKYQVTLHLIPQGKHMFKLTDKNTIEIS